MFWLQSQSVPKLFGALIVPFPQHAEVPLNIEAQQIIPCFYIALSYP